MNLAVFDLDGTLTEHFDEDEECFVQAFIDAFDIGEVNRHWLDYEHHTDLCVVGEVFRTKYGRLPTALDFSRYINCYVARLKGAFQRRAEVVREVEGARSLIEMFMQGTLWRTAIATGGWERSARLKLLAAGFSVDAIPSAFAEDGPSRERIVQTAIDRARSQYGEEVFDKIVLVGDGEWDAKAARRLGLPLIGVADGSQRDVLVRAGARHVFSDFRERAAVVACFDDAHSRANKPNTGGLA
jgi:phosphoglycolate phosphatase-like HAD superfamily hydrolase